MKKILEDFDVAYLHVRKRDGTSLVAALLVLASRMPTFENGICVEVSTDADFPVAVEIK